MDVPWYKFIDMVYDWVKGGKMNANVHFTATPINKGKQALCQVRRDAYAFTARNGRHINGFRLF